MKSVLCAGLAVALLAVGAARADEAPATTTPSGWTADVGVIGRVRPLHLGSPSYTEDAMPIISVKYGDRLSLSLDDGAKWTAIQAKQFSLGPVVEFRQAFNDDLPKGAFHMDDAIEVGGFAKVRTAIGEFETRLRRAETGYDGWSGDVSFDTGGQVAPKLKLGAELRAGWADSRFSQEYFGLHRAAARRDGAPEFQANDYYTAGAELDAAREITARTSLVATLSEDRILGREWRSPLLQSRNVMVAGLGIMRHF